MDGEMDGSGLSKENGQHPLQPRPWKIVAVAAIGAGLQFGWALQCSLLTPYVQLLGISHKWSSFIWLCGPISGLVVQPLAGYYSDRCTSRFGRRRPFIAAAAGLVTFGAILIGFATDIGRLAGDQLGHTTKPRAITIFIVGFWVLDVANNMLMAPCRAFLADLSAEDQRTTRNANAAYSFFCSAGNVLGCAAGSFSHLHNLFHFTSTKACDVYCANLKSCFLISVTLLLTLTTLALTTVREEAIEGIEKKDKTAAFFEELFSALKEFPRSMWILLLVASLNSLGWFPFLLYDTDWMGREVYGGPVGSKLYDSGVHAGSLGLMLNSAVAGATAMAVVLVARGVRGGNRLWGCSNILLAVCMAGTVWISKVAQLNRRHAAARGLGATPSPPASGVKAAALTLFAVLGIPSAVNSTIPYALASIYSCTFGGGQGLSIGVLNISLVIPQLLLSLTSGPWDEVFGGGNLPSFVVGAIAAAGSGVLALTLLPSPPRRAGGSSAAGLKIPAAASH